MKLILLLLFLPTLCFGQEMSDGTKSLQVEKVITIWQFMIPIAVPLLIAIIKAFLPKIPTRWYPIVAPILGAVIDVLLNLADLGDGNGVVGAFLGSSGVGLREAVKHTVNKKIEPKYKI